MGGLDSTFLYPTTQRIKLNVLKKYYCVCLEIPPSIHCPIPYTFLGIALKNIHKKHVNYLFIFYRDIDETKDWIDEKDFALANENYGHDLASVQALQRKHDALERDLSALGEKVYCLTF